jgi:hypothetical protein
MRMHAFNIMRWPSDNMSPLVRYLGLAPFWFWNLGLGLTLSSQLSEMEMARNPNAF